MIKVVKGTDILNSAIHKFLSDEAEPASSSMPQIIEPSVAYANQKNLAILIEEEDDYSDVSSGQRTPVFSR